MIPSFGSKSVDTPTACVDTLQALQHCLGDAAAEGTIHQGHIPHTSTQRTKEAFRQFVLALHHTIGDQSDTDPVTRKAIGKMIQQEMLPYVLQTETIQRLYTKPRGYAGDYWSIELMYRDQENGTGLVGPLVDRCFLDEPAAKAVRNRRGLMAQEIQNTMAALGSRSTTIVNFACGPAREVLDVYQQLDDPGQLQTVLVDFDQEALAFVKQEAEQAGILRCLEFRCDNILRRSLRHTSAESSTADLAYSIGLIDYFSDKMVVKFLDYAYDILRLGGKLIVGNFHPCNTSKALMDYVLEWRLIHRNEQKLQDLFARSKFQRPCTRLFFESEGVNLFAEGIKDP